MIENPEILETMQKALNESGKIKAFEDEYGKIKGYLEITLGKVPEDLVKQIGEISEHYYIFVGNYSFYDMQIGIVYNPYTRQVGSGTWLTPQKEGAKEPDEFWIEFFIKNLAELTYEEVQETQGFSYPMWVFISDNGDFGVSPTK